MDRRICVRVIGAETVLAVLGACGGQADLEVASPLGRGDPVLIARVDVPAPLLAEEGYAGDVRMGDLTGDGRVEFVVVRSRGCGMKPSFLAAFDLQGRELWRTGGAGEQPARPASMAVHDIDGDGAAEVIHLFVGPDVRPPVADSSLADMVIQIRDGRTGRVLRQARPPELREAQGSGPNWVHQRILAADFRGTGQPQDLLMKLGSSLLAFTDELEVLWTYHIEWHEYGRHSAYTPAVGDMDGDGRDEVNGGYYLLDDDGAPLWEGAIADHMDSVIITEWDNEQMRAIASGFGHVLDAEGRVVLRLGPELVPHGQEVRVADFLANSPGPEMIIRYQGHQPDVIVVNNGGEVAHRFRLNSSPNETGMEAVRWNGAAGDALLYNGGVLWRGDGERVARLPELPRPVGDTRMGWYHAIPGDVYGDEREEVVLYNPWDRFVWIYSPAPVEGGAFAGYHAGPRQYNVRLMD